MADDEGEDIKEIKLKELAGSLQTFMGQHVAVTLKCRRARRPTQTHWKLLMTEITVTGPATSPPEVNFRVRSVTLLSQYYKHKLKMVLSISLLPLGELQLPGHDHIQTGSSASFVYL